MIVLVASEIKDLDSNLLKIARNFRRNNTRLDVVNISCEKNMEVLGKIHEIVNVEDESHLINYNDNRTLLVDFLKQT